MEIPKETFTTILMPFSLPVQVNLPFIGYSSWIWSQVSITNLVSYSQHFCRRSTEVQKVFHIVQLLLVLSDQAYVSAELLFVQDLSSHGCSQLPVGTRGLSLWRRKKTDLIIAYAMLSHIFVFPQSKTYWWISRFLVDLQVDIDSSGTSWEGRVLWERQLCWGK